MRGIRIVGLAGVFGLLSLPTGFAQDAAGAAPKDRVVKAKALDIEVGGEVDLLHCVRNDDFLDVNGKVLRTGAKTKGGGESYTFPFVAVNLATHLTDQVYSRLTLSTPKYRVNPAGATAATPFGGAGTRIGAADFGASTQQIYVTEASIEFREFLFSKDFSMTLGIQPFKLDLRGNGESLFVNVGESEDPFFGAKYGVVGDGVVTGGNSAFGTNKTPTIGNAKDGTGPGSSTGLAGTVQASGLKVAFDAKPLTLTGFWFNLAETRDAQKDEELWGAAGDISLGSHGKFSVLAAVLANGQGRRIYSAGLGADIFPYRSATSAFETYAEVIVQGGHYLGAANDLGFSKIMDHGYAAYGGLRYDFSLFAARPFLDLSYWELSGDDNPTDRENDDYVSLEDVDTTLIAEDNDIGLDLDANLRAVKVQFGSTFDLVKDDAISDDFGFKVVYAYLELVSNPRGSADKIGDEIDGRFTYRYSKNARFEVTTGWLFDTEVLAPKSKGALQVSTIGLRLSF